MKKLTDMHSRVESLEMSVDAILANECDWEHAPMGYDHHTPMPWLSYGSLVLWKDFGLVMKVIVIMVQLWLTYDCTTCT